MLKAISEPRSAAKKFISRSVDIEKVPGTGDELGRAEIVGGADATNEVAEALGGAATLVGVQEIAASTNSATIAFNM